MLDKYINMDTIFLNVDAKNRKDLFHKVSEKLRKNKYVREGFEEFIQNREDNFPTGLKLENDTVAIPHGDSKYIQKPFVAVVTLQNPIKQRAMDDNEQLDIDILFFLGLDNSNHLKLLQSIINLIQKKDFLSEIREAESQDEILRIIHEGEIQNVKN